MQSQPKCLNDFENGIKARAALTGERLVKTFSRKTRIARNLRHAFGASDVPKRFGDERGFSARFRKACFQVGRHLLRSSEMFSNIIS